LNQKANLPMEEQQKHWELSDFRGNATKLTWTVTQNTHLQETTVQEQITLLHENNREL